MVWELVKTIRIPGSPGTTLVKRFEKSQKTIPVEDPPVPMPRLELVLKGILHEGHSKP